MIKNYSLGYSIPFVGRTKELADIVARLKNPECWLLSLIGLGGSGKTRLAIEAAKAVASDFPHGTIFVALQPLTQSDLLVPTIAQAVGLTFYGSGDLQSQLLEYFHDKNLLLILDNFEHLMDGAKLVADILATASEVKIIITSREALNLQQEWLYPLQGMSIPPSVYSDAFEDYESVQLFLHHARRVQPNFSSTTEQEAVIRICRMTAGLPLAIEIAASWLKGLSAGQIATEMQSNLDFLSSTMRNIEERHRSMRAVFDQSWRLLSEDERLIFAQLSVFRGGFGDDAAKQVAGVSLSSLAVLVEKSLVHMESAHRFGIHELLRQYAMEKLQEYDRIEATYAVYSGYFARLMQQYEAELKQPQQLETMRAIERDFENIRLAWDWSIRNQAFDHLHSMLNGLYLFGFLRSRYREIIFFFQNALDQPISDVSLLGQLLTRSWGYLHWLYQPDYDEGLKYLQQALKIAMTDDNPFEIALAHLMVGYILMSIRHYDETLPHFETSKALFESIGELYYVCWVLHRIGYAYGNLNQIDKEIEYTKQSLSLAHDTNNHVALVICLYNLGSVYIMAGDYEQGKNYCDEAMQVATQSGHQDQIAHALSLLALCAFCQGDYLTCQNYVERSRVIIDEINSLVFEPYNLSLLILLACKRADYAEATRLSELGKEPGTNTMGLQLTYWAMSALACGLGNIVQARTYIQKLLQISELNGQAAVIVWAAPSATYVLADNDPERAVELLGWVFSYPDAVLHWVNEWSLFAELQIQLQEATGLESYQRHWGIGETLSFSSIKTAIEKEFHAANTVNSILTSREHEILRLMSVGMTNPQIAAQLVIGAGTVKTHTLNIYRKLDVANRTQAIVRAQELGLLLS